MRLNIPYRWIRTRGSLLLLTLLLVTLFVQLGIWQWNRYNEKKLLKEKLENRIKEPTLHWQSVLSMMNGQNTPQNFEPIRYRLLEVSGQFLNNTEILLDNQLFDGQVGYRLFTPLLTQDNNIVLIDRGWIPLGKSRKTLPTLSALTTIEGKITITGIINQISTGLKLQAAKPLTHMDTPTTPYLVQHIDFEILAHLFAETSSTSSLKPKLVPFVIQVNQPRSLVYQTLPTFSGIPANRHLGYAVQWFGMAIATLVYFLVITFNRRIN